MKEKGEEEVEGGDKNIGALTKKEDNIVLNADLVEPADPTETPTENKLDSPPKKDLSPRSKTLSLFKAIKDVSRLNEPGVLENMIDLGLKSEYTKKDLKVAQCLYNELILYDVERNGITLELLKLARDTNSAGVNLTKPIDPIDKKLRESNTEVR